MSAAIPILFALLLSLISAPAESGQEMDPILLVRQTLRHWWKTYKENSYEVTLGYCWADYLHKLSIGLPDLSYQPLVAARNHPDMLFEMVRSLESLFPNITADAMSSLGVTREGKHPRARRAIISKSISNSDKHGGVVFPSKTIREQPRGTMNETEQVPSNGRARRQQTLPIYRQRESPSRWHTTWRKRNVKADDALPNTRAPREDRGIKGDPEGRRGLSNNGGSSSSLQLRQANAGDPRTNAVKLMGFEQNSSPDSLLLFHGAVAGRPSLESRGSGKEAVERTAFSQFKAVSRRKRHAQQPKENLKNDGNVFTIHPVFSPQYNPSPQQTSYKSSEFYPLTAQKSNQGNATPTSSVPLSPNTKPVFDDLKDLADQPIDLVKSIIFQPRKNQLPLQQQSSIVSVISSFIITAVRTVAMYIQAVRNVIYRLYKNQAFRCTKDYLWFKLIQWLETYQMD
ncbi:hypothetical protein PUN28_017014 [Cardiocondyla obscurior]|uniref:Uncharacterized protein n=1 Tax=Cardiocondyla obscurior TaxID=286306 RepID=A0AAW2EM86_9HYME